VLAANPLISVTPGLMIWTIVCFLIALFVLGRILYGTPFPQALGSLVLARTGALSS